MYIPFRNIDRMKKASRSRRHRAKLRAKNRRRVNRMAGRKLSAKR